MYKENPQLSLVIGCGPKGAEWISKQKNRTDLLVGIDTKIPSDTKLTQGQQMVLGNVFKLPVKSESVNKIYGDFIVNGLISREIAASQIMDNPELLDTDYFPKLVRDWFVLSLNRSHDSVRRNVKEVGTLLKTTALREMWRVLAPGGTMQILDFEYNTNWLGHYAPQIMNEKQQNISLRPARIVQDDFERSSSLSKVIKGSTYVQKLNLMKTPGTKG